MPSFVKEAHVFRNIKTGAPCIEIKYTTYREGEGYVNLAECFDASPVGGWTDLIYKRENLRYEEFLNTKVEKTMTTRRSMAVIELDNVLCENKNIFSLIRVMNAIKILDPTFVPPIINIRCAWQKNFVKEVCMYSFPDIIHNCRNEFRLEKLFNVLQTIESEL